MIARSDRLQIWASQLAANDFPPVCAMTGRPAETWRKFRFSTPPVWTYALLVLLCLGVIGIAIAAVIISLVSERATGHLPLTHSSRRVADLATWVPAVLIVGPLALWTVVVGAAALQVDVGDANAGAVAGVTLLAGVLLLVGGLVGRLVVTPLVVPRGKVTPQQPGYYDRLVELRNMHPAFVAAVQQMHYARAGQYAPGFQTQSLPGLG